MLQRIGNCRIVEEVASGGMAVVYRAIQDPLGRVVAIKALKSAMALHAELSERFEREARALAALQHENLLHVYDFHREHNTLFIVMEIVEGIDLYDLLERCTRLPYDVAAIIGLQIARALDYIHYRGIVHRDVKPANVMLSRAGGVKLMDFGIAQDDKVVDITTEGTGLGTPSYMSPEQIVGEKVDARSDIFSFGVMLYHMVTGEKPFVETEDKSVMQQIRAGKYRRARAVRPEVPRELERIIDACMARRPQDRYRSAQHLHMALERFLATHVAMNHGARLVMFLRGQDIITQLEADEYLRPAMLADASVNLPARHVIRRASLTHAVVAGVFFLMLGLIHVAPLGAAAPVAPTIIEVKNTGYLRVHAYPWAEVTIDGQQHGWTPMAEPIALTQGEHTIRLVHEAYEPIERTVMIPTGAREAAVRVDIDFERVGKLRPGARKPEVP